MKKYAKKKVKTLRELGIKVSKKDKKRMKNLENEIQIDNFARSIIFRENERPIKKKVVWCGDCLAEYMN